VLGKQGDKQEKVCHLVLEQKLDLVSAKMGEKIMVGSPVVKRSHQTKVKMEVVKVEKVAAKKASEAKKLAKLAMAAELGSIKKLPRILKGEKEEPSKPFNLENGERGASTKKESSKGEASKDNV